MRGRGRELKKERNLSVTLIKRPVTLNGRYG
jgi:hypothetical protein